MFLYELSSYTSPTIFDINCDGRLIAKVHALNDSDFPDRVVDSREKKKLRQQDESIFPLLIQRTRWKLPLAAHKATGLIAF